MAKLLTTRQVQDLLKVDRITVYRMLNDGRLKGVKIGNHWRFSESEIDRLLGAEPADDGCLEEENPLTDFPSDCVQKVQEIFAGILGIGAITVTLKGEPLTEPTCSNPFCELMLSNEKSRQACQESWRKMALRTTGKPPFQICHAGLCYLRSPIEFEGKQTAWMVSGQFYISSPDREKEEPRFRQLAQKFNIPFSELAEKYRQIPVIDKKKQTLVQEWTPRLAGTVQSILCERSDLLDRLERIAALSAIQPAINK